MLNAQRVSKTHFIDNRVAKHFSKAIIHRKHLIIDLDETTRGLQQFTRFFTEFVCQGGTTLFVCQDEDLYDVFKILKTHDFSGQLIPGFGTLTYWPPGFISNTKRMESLTSKFYREIRTRGIRPLGVTPEADLERHELSMEPIDKTIRLDPIKTSYQHYFFRNLYRGISEETRNPDLIFFIPTTYNEEAIEEANSAGILTAGILSNTNDPTTLKFPIMVNPDSYYAVAFVVFTMLNPLFKARAEKTRVKKVRKKLLTHVKKIIGANQMKGL